VTVPDVKLSVEKPLRTETDSIYLMFDPDVSVSLTAKEVTFPVVILEQLNPFCCKVYYH